MHNRYLYLKFNFDSNILSFHTIVVQRAVNQKKGCRYTIEGIALACYTVRHDNYDHKISVKATHGITSQLACPDNIRFQGPQAFIKIRECTYNVQVHVSTVEGYTIMIIQIDLVS